MENLVEIKNNQVITSSRQVAECFGKRHDKLLFEIKRMYSEYIVGIGMSEMVETPLFYEHEYMHPQNNQKYKEYLMNRDGFSLLVMGFTGKEALQWKIKYINAFNAMEQELLHPKKQLPNFDENELKEKRVNALLKNAKAREAKLWLELANRTDIKEYKQIAESYAGNVLAEKEVFALPQVEKKTYSATEIAKILNVSAKKIGALANKYNLKTEQFGKWFYDKSRYSNKEVETFRYYENAISQFRFLLNSVTA